MFALCFQIEQIVETAQRGLEGDFRYGPLTFIRGKSPFPELYVILATGELYYLE